MFFFFLLKVAIAPGGAVKRIPNIAVVRILFP